MFGYVYKTTNLINGKTYVGKHRRSYFDKKYYGSGKHLKSAINKYGIENFKVEVLEWCNSNKELANKEIFYIELLKPEYNIWHMPQEYSDNQYCWQKGHIPYNKGTKLSEEQKRKISQKTKEAMKRPDVKEKSMKGSLRMKDSDKREEMRQIMLKKMTPEFKSYISEQTKKAMSREDVKKRNIENTKKAMWRPDVRLNFLLGLQRRQKRYDKELKQDQLEEIENLMKERRVRLTNENQ